MILALVSCLFAPCPSWAPQDPGRLRVSEPIPAVVRLGESAYVELSVPSATSTIVPRVPAVDGLRIFETPPSRESFQSIVNGRIESRSSTKLRVVVTPLRAGRFEIPPFVVEVDRVAERTRPLVLEAVEDLRGAEHGFLSVTPSAHRVYVHEPLRLRVEVGLDQALSLVTGQIQDGRLGFDAAVQAPWLDELPGAVRIQAEPGTPQRVLIVNESWENADYTPAYERDGRRFHRLTFERAFLPTQSGRIELPQPTLRFTVASGAERRGLFGERVPSERENLYAYGEPAVVEVLPIPAEGRPADYSGAVGRFTLAASVDRREVRVGNSVKLTLAMRGLGNTEFLRVPELDRVPGFHLRGKTEQRSNEEARAVYDLTPLSTDVREIPPIRWSYFDTRPGVERFATLATEPIALDVQPLPEGGGLEPLPGDEARPVVPGVDDIHDIVPLDGADPWRVPAAPPAWLSSLLVALPWLLFGLLAWSLPRLRSRRADVAGRRARGAARVFERTLGAGGDPGMALVDYLAARLGVPAAAVIEPALAQRLREAGFEAQLSQELQQAVERGVAVRYGGGAPLPADVAVALVARCEQRPARVPAALLGLYLACLLPAQDAAAQDAGVAAYRRGDYAAAATEFARAAAADPDRRYDYNLGNCEYRQGRFARALLHYERARLAAPRDPELLANIALARKRLGLGPGEAESFTGAVAALRERFTAAELLGLAVLIHALVAWLLWSGRRRPLLRGGGLLFLVPAVLLALELVVWRPARPLRGILLQESAVRAEPREDLPAVLELKPGVTVDLLARGEGYAKVRAAGRSGWIRADAIGVVE